MSKPSTFNLKQEGRDHRGVFVHHTDGTVTFSVPLREHGARAEETGETTAVLGLAFGTASWERFERDGNLTDVRVISIKQARHFSVQECKEAGDVPKFHLGLHDNPEFLPTCAGYYLLCEDVYVRRCEDGEKAFFKFGEGVDPMSSAKKRSEL